MSYFACIRREIREIDADLRRMKPPVFLVISCLALVLAATIAFGGLHLL